MLLARIGVLAFVMLAPSTCLADAPPASAPDSSSSDATASNTRLVPFHVEFERPLASTIAEMRPRLLTPSSHALSVEEFFRVIGREDLAREQHQRRITRFTLLISGLGTLIPGFFVTLVGTPSGAPGYRPAFLAGGGALMAVGAGLLIGIAKTGEPMAPIDARLMARRHNAAVGVQDSVEAPEDDPDDESDEEHGELVPSGPTTPAIAVLPLLSRDGAGLQLALAF